MTFFKSRCIKGGAAGSVDPPPPPPPPLLHFCVVTMAFLNKVKNLFRANPQEKKLPSYIQDNVNPKDHWNIIGELGDGAFGKVEKAVSRTNPRLFAASKAIEIQEGEELEDFLVEIEILTECKGHPVMLGLYSTYFYENKLTMLLEFCGGGAIDNIMCELGHPLKEDQIRYIGYNVCDALKWLHSQNVIHRDLKAGNILLTTDGQVRLADFGVSAKLKSEREKRDTFIGTPYWMAPEVMACETFKDQPYDCISDIWSFGITLIEMAQGEPPHSDVSVMRVIIKVQKSEPPTLMQPSQYTKAFSDILTKCLVKDPRNRQSAAEVFKHPWFADAPSKRKAVYDLLVEVQADVQEEMIIEGDEESVAGSDEISQRRGDSWSSASDSPRPTTSDGFKVPMVPPPSMETPPPDTPHKKRAAPPPPQEAAVIHRKKSSDSNGKREKENSSYAEFSFSNSNTSSDATAEFSTPMSSKNSVHLSTPAVLSVNTSSSAGSASEFVSPRREALSILDELTTTLDDEQGGSNFFNSPRSPATESAQSKPMSPEHSIRDTILANRDVKSPSPQLKQSSPSASASSYEESVDLSFYKPEPVEHSAHVVAQQQFEKASSSLQRSVVVNNMRKSESPHSSKTGTPESLRKVSQESESVFKRKPQETTTGVTLRDFVHGKAELTVTVPEKATSMRNKIQPNVSPSPSQIERTNQHSSTPIPANPEYFEISYSKKQQDKTPPPEPPVDYEGSSKENAAPSVAPVAQRPQPSSSSTANTNTNTSTSTLPPKTQPAPRPFGGRRDSNRQTITKKTRTYMIDGVQVTSTTVHVLGVKDDKVQRKQQLHDLRRLQRDEARQKQELQTEGMKLVEEQAKKFSAEQTNLSRTSELEMDVMERRQRREIEDTEGAQEQELRNAQKRLRVEQEKDMRAFKERLKQEMKIFKQELTMLSKVQRKDALRLRKDQIELEHQLKEKDFMMQLQQNAESMLHRMVDKHKERMASLEKQFLMQKHNLLRAKENNIWELEDKQMREKFVLHRKLFKDEYYLLRTQMLARHQREMAQIEKMHQEEEDDLIRALTLDRKKLPKMLRAETKTRSVMFKESLRISMTNMPNTEMQERIRRFDEQEALRMRAALEEHDLKSQKKLQALKERHQEAIIELDEMQNEKRKQLLEKERNTMKEHECKYHDMREGWQENLITRKTVLEEKFEDELAKQEVFYGVSFSSSQASTLSGRHMP
uniref:Protein kinase domain-containing protein n=1 Tax=Caenorhabditis japonica TaxID=281687 RepID=A0A8R1I1B1_CAEJA